LLEAAARAVPPHGLATPIDDSLYPAMRGVTIVGKMPIILSTAGSRIARSLGARQP
jgi:hypothetical protein